MNDESSSRDGSEVPRSLLIRDRYRRKLRESETPEQRMERFRELQMRSFQLLQSSPAGLKHFLRRNYRRRRAIRGSDGLWRPISTD